MVDAPREAGSSEERDGPLADPRLARIGIALGLTFALLVGLELHGFSLAQWHTVIDRSAPDEVLLGAPRYVRADDWLVQLPLAYAQSAHDPPFPLVNENLGSGQNMLLPIDLPVANLATLFRPSQWGFFLDDDLGTAWLWWSQVLGLFGVWLLVFFIVSEGRLALSTAGATLVVVSPYFQLWSFSKATIPIAMGLCFVASVGVASARTRRGIVLSALLLAGSGAAFALALYPPGQVSLAYLYLALTLAWLFDPRQRPRWRAQLRLRVAAAVGAGALAAVAVASFAFDAREAIALIQQTAYPGARISTGGDAPTWRLFTAHFASALFVRDWGPLANVSEATSFWLTFPAVAGALLLRLSRDRLALALVVFCVAAILYREVGIPAIAARASLLSFVPAHRTTLAIGLADLLLLVRMLAVRREAHSLRPLRAATLATAWALAVGGAGFLLRREVTELPVVAIVGAVLANAAVAYSVVLRIRPALVVASMALALGATTLWFNPLARGGADFLRANPLAEKILAIDAERSGDTVWLTYGSSDLANVIRTLGVRSLGGNTNLPELALWSRLDPDGTARSVYNRYAHVSFRPPIQSGDPPRFRLSSPHGFVVLLDPEGDGARALGATHLLVRLRRSSLAYWARFEPLATVEPDLVLYALPLTPR